MSTYWVARSALWVLAWAAYREAEQGDGWRRLMAAGLAGMTRSARKRRALEWVRGRYEALGSPSLRRFARKVVLFDLAPSGRGWVRRSRFLDEDRRRYLAARRDLGLDR